MKDNQALIVVDVQKDFLETGALPVKDGSQVVPVINRISPKFKHVVFTPGLASAGPYFFCLLSLGGSALQHD